MELAPGLHQIRSPLGPRYLFQYLLAGERHLLVDTGMHDTPEAVTRPYLQSLGLHTTDLTWVAITHADVDHFGGNGTLKAMAPQAQFMCHQADARWVESRQRILAERYQAFKAEHGIEYDSDTWDWIGSGFSSTDVPLDIELSGRERLRLGPKLQVEVLHLPGHSNGHIGFYCAEGRWAIITDAALGEGLVDVDGNLIAPPPYFNLPGYLKTLDLLDSLGLNMLLTAHYPIMRGEAVRQFLTLSRQFVHRLRAAVVQTLAEARTHMTLREITHESNARTNRFTVMAVELTGPVLAHLQELEQAGAALRTVRSGKPAWSWGPR